MTSKYDRNIDEIERARMEESRIWSQRNPEPAPPYGVGPAVGSYGYADPIWAAQTRPFSQPFVNPLYQQQLLPHGYNQQFGPGFIPGQQFGSIQGVPGAFQTAQPLPQQGFSPYAQQPQINPGFLPFNANPYLPFQLQFGMYPLAHLYGQPFIHPFANPYQQMGTQLQNIGQFEQWPGQLSGWEQMLQRNQLNRQGSRAFGRPPRAYKRSDELIRDEICKRLALTPEIDATDLEVVVKDGEVTLRGIVDDRFAKRLVEDITECTFGVRDVVNDVRIGSRFSEQEFSGVTKGKEK